AGTRTARRRERTRWPGSSSCMGTVSAVGGPSRAARPPGRRTMVGMGAPAAENREATEAWSGPLFECFVQYRDLVAGGLGAHGEAALAAHPPRPGDRVVDLGCGFGDTTQRLGELVGPDGDVLGIDVSEPFIQMAGEEAEAADAANVRFAVGDVQITEFEESFDYAFSRMGIMFFANPVQALRNVC